MSLWILKDAASEVERQMRKHQGLCSIIAYLHSSRHPLKLWPSRFLATRTAYLDHYSANISAIWLPASSSFFKSTGHRVYSYNCPWPPSKPLIQGCRVTHPFLYVFCNLYLLCWAWRKTPNSNRVRKQVDFGLIFLVVERSEDGQTALIYETEDEDKVCKYKRPTES